MRIDPARSSRWMTDFDAALVRGKQPILHGNIVDQFLLNDEYLGVQDFLTRYFVAGGYEVVGVWDPADGLTFAEPGMRRTFDRIVHERLAGGAGTLGAESGTGTPRPAGPTYDTGAAPRPEGASESEPAQRNPRRLFLQEPREAVAQMRALLRQHETASAFVLNLVDRIAHPSQPSTCERPSQIELFRAFTGASFITTGPAAGRRNALVGVATQLSEVPPWFYQDNPLVTLVPVGRPSREERLAFVRRFGPNFHAADAIPPDELEQIIGDFADLTDGLAAWDLDAVRRTSLAQQIPLGRPRELVHYFLYGQRDDPWEKLDARKVRDARISLSKRVIGQPAATNAVVDMLLSAKVGVSMSSSAGGAGKPKGVFFFVGPTGVGKTELAKTLAELIFGDDAAFARFDMSEYAEQHAAEKLTGSPPGYVGYEEGGQLTNRLRQRPFGLLLFDEIEKAHGRVMDKFLQILEDGRLTDGQGQTVYFSQSVIIFTSNIGSAELDLADGAADGSAAGLDYTTIRDHFLRAVRRHFTEVLGRPELFNRLGDNVVVFDILRADHVDGIAAKFLGQLAESLREKAGLECAIDESLTRWVRRHMLVGDNMLFGGRRIRTFIEAAVERPLNRWLFFNEPARGGRIALGAGGDPTQLTVDGASADAAPSGFGG